MEVGVAWRSSQGAQKNMESQIWSHSRWSLCNKVVLGLDQDEDGLVLRYQGCILAISDNFIPKSMLKLSIFSKKKISFFVQKWSKSRVDFCPILLEDSRVVLAPKELIFAISKGFCCCFVPKKF